MMSAMTSSMAQKIIQKKQMFKTEVKENTEKFKKEMHTLETQLFTTKVETETLKIDKKYFEDQVSELQKKNQEMISNIENIMSEQPKKGLIEKRPSDALLPQAPPSLISDVPANKMPLANSDVNVPSPLPPPS